MRSSSLRALEFDRIVSVVAGLAVTSLGRTRLTALEPSTDGATVAAAQRSTSEGVRFLADHPGFPLRAPSDLEDILDAFNVEGRGLEPLRLVGLADYLESIEQSRGAVHRHAAPLPVLRGLVAAIASFGPEIADVRRKIDAAGEIADDASPALKSMRARLRKQRSHLRSTLDSFLRGREATKYLQEQVVTDRNGRYVLMVRAEHRSAIPGIVHGGSTSGASLFVEPLETVEINNDIVALEEREAEEIRRILLALTNAFRARGADVRRTVDVATELDVIQGRARFSLMVGGVEPLVALDGDLELRAARHPLLMSNIRERLGGAPPATPKPHFPRNRETRGAEPTADPSAGPRDPVPVDIVLVASARVLIVAGPNTGGKTVALKTAGLLVAMAQAGLHIPAAPGSRLPVFRSLFADIGDEQSISASLSTFSAHIANVVSMNDDLILPGLVLLDEVGAGTDPAEGGALGVAVIDHFRSRGAHLIATTHDDSVKSYASITAGAVGAAFGFNPDTYAPTYQLVYGSPGRSLAIEIAARLGVPAPVVAAARNNLTQREQRLTEHLARVDAQLRALEEERLLLGRERFSVTETEKRLRGRELALREREDAFRRRLDAKLEEQVRAARREIDAVIDGLKTRTALLADRASGTGGVSTGDAGLARSQARSDLEAAVGRLRSGFRSEVVPEPTLPPATTQAPLVPGATVAVATLGVEGHVIEVRGTSVDVDVRGKRFRVAAGDLRVTVPAPAVAAVRVNVDLQPKEGALSEISVIGYTVDEAIARIEKFLDDSTVSDQRTLRVIHGHGTGQLRRALTTFLKEHPLVARLEPARPEHGGSGVTVVELKD